MAERSVHFVGSFPADDTADAMRAMLAGAGPRLRTLPSGETRRHQTYIEPIVEDLVRQGVLEPIGIARCGGRTIHRLHADCESGSGAMDLGYLREAGEALPILEGLRGSGAFPDLALQVGMPTDFTLALVALGLRATRSQRKVFADASVRAIEGIRELAGDAVVVQLEAPGELVLSAKTRPLHRQLDRILGLSKGIGALAAAAPEGTRFGVHLCLGGRRNKAAATMRTARPLVDLANAVARHWPSGRKLEYIHGPLAAGDIPPSTQPEFYAPLADLDLGEGTAFYAGFVHDGPTEELQRHTLHRIENALGRRVDGVGCACGLGRRTRAAADLLVARAAALAAD